MTVRYYSSVAAETTLVGSITNSSTTIQLASTVGLPALTPFTLALDYESASEELVEVTAVAGPTLTVIRAIDGTSATNHNSAARVRHVSSARDFSDSRNHENASTNVHGVGASAAVVGTTTTQSLTNKTLVDATGTLDRIDIKSSGTPWTTSVSGLAANNVDLMRWKQDPSSTHEVAGIANDGGFRARNATVGADSVNNVYRLRVTKENGSTDIFSVLSGGSVKTFPDLNQSGVTVQPRSANSTTRAFSVRDQAETVDRFAVWQDGHTDINGSDASFSQFDVTGAVGQSASFTRVLDSNANTLHAVGSDTKTSANGTLDVRNNFHTGGVSSPVLRVFGRNPGQTGDLQQWVDGTNTIVAAVDSGGDFTMSNTVWSTYTPTWTNAPATSTNVGWYKKFGKMVYFESYSVFSATGATANTVTGTLPSTPFRAGAGAASTRQIVFGQVANANTSGSGTSGTCMGQILAGGTGATISMVDFQNIPIHDNHWQNGTIVTLQGWYREA